MQAQKRGLHGSQTHPIPQCLPRRAGRPHHSSGRAPSPPLPPAWRCAAAAGATHAAARTRACAAPHPPSTACSTQDTQPGPGLRAQRPLRQRVPLPGRPGPAASPTATPRAARPGPGGAVVARGGGAELWRGRGRWGPGGRAEQRSGRRGGSGAEREIERERERVYTFQGGSRGAVALPARAWGRVVCVYQYIYIYLNQPQGWIGVISLSLYLPYMFVPNIPPSHQPGWLE